MKAFVTLLAAMFVTSGLLPVAVAADSPAPPQVMAQQKPGQFEILEGSPLQLRVTPPKSDSPVKSYKWKIVSGKGGKLIDPKTPDAVFYAKKIKEQTELFELQLTTKFENRKKTKASILVQVHKRPDKSESGSKTVVHRRAGPWIGFGLGFGFGYLWNYPIYVPIIIPVPPEEVWPPGEQLPAEAYPLDETDIGELPDSLQPEQLYGASDFEAFEDDLLAPDALEAELAAESFEADLPVADDYEMGIEAETMDGYDEPVIDAEPMEPMPEPEPMPMDDYGGGYDDFGGGFDDMGMMDY